MHVTERIRAIKLLDQLLVHPEMAERLGLSFSCKYLLCEDGSTNLPAKQPVRHERVGSLCGTER